MLFYPASMTSPGRGTLPDRIQVSGEKPGRFRCQGRALKDAIV